MGVFLGCMIRLLIGLVGIVLIILFTHISHAWFLGCFGVFYAVFLMTDSWLMVHLLRFRHTREGLSRYE